MSLSLKYTDEYGEPRRVAVSGEIFTVGRHSANDLCVPDHRLSREHIRIEQFNDAFYVSDSNSSNGTTINETRLSSAVMLKNGDRLNLGGAVQIQIEIALDAPAVVGAAVNNAQPANVENIAYSPKVEASNQISADQSKAASSASGIPTAFFWMVPIFGLLMLMIGAAVLFVLSGDGKEVVQNNEDVEIVGSRRTPRTDDTPTDDTPTPQKTETPSSVNSGNFTNNQSANDSPPAPKTSAEQEKVEQNAAAFMRRIAQNDPRPFLTGKQIETVNSKISQFKSSSALAANLKAVKKNQSQFESLANSKNLKAQFLATAALAKLGNSPGDPLAVANQILPVLNELKITLDNKLADDNLLIIAAFERGAAGKPRSLQSTLEAIAKTTPNVSPREIRTIWFLRDKGKITDAEFDFAVRFLAIGAITQNPKDFNVGADAVQFD